MLKIILFIALLFTSCSGTKSISKQKEMSYNIRIDLNETDSSFYGLPLKNTGKSYIYLYLSDGMETMDTLIQGVGVFKLDLNDKMINFILNNDTITVSGQFLVPDYMNVDYATSFDPVSYITKLSPVFFYRPIRSGHWYFLNEKTKNKSELIFNILLKEN